MRGMTTFRLVHRVEGDMGPLDRRDGEFTSFVEEHGDALLRTAHFLTGDRWQAEDLVQLALTKTYLAWPAARGKLPYPYARQVLLNCHTDLWRRRRWRESTTAPEDLPAGGRAGTSSGGDLAQAAADRDAVDQALARLTPRERAVVVLRYCEDLSERETARLLKVSIGTIKSLNARALTKLRADAECLPGTITETPRAASCSKHAHGPEAACPNATTRKDSSCVDH
jgi:RNA polymerase sigma-70 factor (sigma-E family)